MTKISNQYSLTNILTADLANSRLGINNVSPTVALDVTGAGKFSSSVTATSFNATTTNIFAVDGTERMRITSGGFVGLGVTPNSNWYSSWKVLQLGNSGNIHNTGTDFNATRLTNGAYYSNSDAWTYLVSSCNPAMINLQADGALTFLNAASGTAGGTFSWNERMRITSAGNVGIGTSSPGYSLHVNGTAYAVGHIGGYVTASSGYVNETQTITTNGTSYYLRKYTGNANGSSTTIFNITGLNTANGTFADIYAVAQKDATGSAINTNLEVQINGQYMYGIQANGTAANTRICAFKVCRMDSSWVIIGTVRT